MLRLAYTVRFFSILAVFSLILLPTYVLSCESCRSVDPNSPMTAGMNAAIIMLLIMTNFVLGGFLSFFLYLRRRARLFSNK